MANVTIGKKLFAAFGVVLLISLVMGFVSIRNGSKLGESTDTLGHHFVSTLNLAGEVDMTTSEMIAASRGILLSGQLKDPARARALKTHYDELVATVRQDTNELITGTFYPEIGELAREQVLNRLDPLAQANSELYDAVMRNDLAAAEAISSSKTEPLGVAMDDAGSQLKKVEVKSSQTYAEKAIAGVEPARYLNLALLALAIVSGAVAVYIVRGVTSTIRGSLGALRDGADQVADAASQVSASSQSLAQGASEQAASLRKPPLRPSRSTPWLGGTQTIRAPPPRCWSTHWRKFP